MRVVRPGVTATDYPRAVVKSRFRWGALGLAAGGTALATLGFLSTWIATPGIHDRDVIGYIDRVVLGWGWFFIAIAIVGVTFAMLVGARRNYLPPPVMSFVVATLGAGALLSAIHATVTLGHLRAVPERWQRSMFELGDGTDGTPLDVTWSPILTIAGFALQTAGSLWLGLFARGRRRAQAAERARVDRAYAAQVGDVVVPEEEPIPRL